MAERPQRFIIIQTAFIGDVVLTLPLFQVLRRSYPSAMIDGVVIPRAANLLEHHSAIDHVRVYDKRKRDRGIRGMLKMVRSLRSHTYDVAILPHRSIRSALLARLSGIPRRIGFDRSAGAFLLTDRVAYRLDAHEIDRNLALLTPLIEHAPERELPVLQPTAVDEEAVRAIIPGAETRSGSVRIAIAPGTVWKTKQWLPESFTELVRLLVEHGTDIVLVGGKEDESLCEAVRLDAGEGNIVNAAGKLTLRQTAALLKQCRVLVSNDSAPMHLAVAVGTPVVALFGATVPSIGFSPVGPKDIVIETEGLACRPCSIHGTEQCPIGTFDCMRLITPERVFASVESLLGGG